MIYLYPMKIQGIYKIINKINNKIYIGQSTNIYKRFNSHKCEIKKGINHPLYNSVRKYNIDNFEFIILEEVTNVLLLDQKEQYWMDHYKSYDKNFGYNLYSVAGKSCVGYKHTIKTKKRMSKARKGRKLSPETRKNMSISRKGRKVSNKTRLKISKAHKGKKFSEEHLLHLSEARKRRITSDETKLKLSTSHLGKKHSEKTKAKMSLASKNKPKSEEHKRNISLAKTLPH